MVPAAVASGRAFHLPVEPPVPQVIDHAAGRAHAHRACKKQRHHVEPGADVGRRHGDHPPAGQEQQPPADRTVQPGDEDIGMAAARHQPPPAGKVDIGMPTVRQSGLDSGSCRPRFLLMAISLSADNLLRIGERAAMTACKAAWRALNVSNDRTEYQGEAVCRR